MDGVRKRVRVGNSSVRKAKAVSMPVRDGGTRKPIILPQVMAIQNGHCALDTVHWKEWWALESDDWFVVEGSFVSISRTYHSKHIYQGVIHNFIFKIHIYISREVILLTSKSIVTKLPLKG